jgi:hypothetical protein
MPGGPKLPHDGRADHAAVTGHIDFGIAQAHCESHGWFCFKTTVDLYKK